MATWYASELTIQIKADLSRDGQSLILTKAGFNLPCLSWLLECVIGFIYLFTSYLFMWLQFVYGLEFRR